MSKEQIEKMANILWHIPCGYSLNSYNDCEIIAAFIYKDGGYREQIESEWIFHQDGSATCKHCRTTQKCVWDMDNLQSYCGHCGAKMKGV